MKTISDDFYPFMKVFLSGEYGLVTEQFHEVKENNLQTTASKLYGVIRWDSCNVTDCEDWRGLWGTFIDAGGHEIDKNYEFHFINADGTLKAM